MSAPVETPLTSTLQRWTRSWDGRLILVGLGYSLLYIAWVILDLWPSRANLISDAGILPLNILTLIMAARVAHRTHEPRSRMAWVMITLAHAMYGLGSCFFLYFDLILSKPAYPSIADLFHLASPVLLLCGLLLFPIKQRTMHELRMFWLDASVVLVGGGMLMWQLLLGPSASAEYDSWLSAAVGLAYPMTSLGLLFGLTVVSLQQPTTQRPGALYAFAAALSANCLGDVWFGYLNGRGGYLPGDLPDAFWMVYLIAMAISAQLQFEYVETSERQPVGNAPAQTLLVYLPYAATLVGYTLFLFEARALLESSLAVTILGIVLLSVLVTLRQIQALRASRRAQHAAELARRAEERAKDLAEKANRAKSDFLSQMSHELRTPLTAILGFTQLIQFGVLDEDQRDASDRVIRAGRHLLVLINEILDLSHVESGHMEFSQEPLVLRELITDTVKLVQPLAGQRQVKIMLQPSARSEPSVLADPQRLAQVLLNLLSNAIKYNKQQGSVIVTYGSEEQGRLKLWVQDTGCGIEPEDLSRLFRPFDRLDIEQREGKIEGTGLGLALSKRLLEGMQGSIGVESTLGQGSIFWIDLPQPGFVPVAAPAPAAPNPPVLPPLATPTPAES